MADGIYSTTKETRKGTVFRVVPPQPSKAVSAALYVATVVVLGQTPGSFHWVYQFDRLLVSLAFWGVVFFVLIRWPAKHLETVKPFTMTAIPDGLLVLPALAHRRPVTPSLVEVSRVLSAQE